MTEQGWVKLYRKLPDDHLWQLSTPEQKVIMITLLLMASHTTNEWEWGGQKFKIQPGQFITSLDSIQQRCGKGISIKNVRTALNRFEKFGFLANQSAKTGRLITIANWAKYQSSDDEVAKQPADNRQRAGKELATIKNDKNVKKDTHASSTLEDDFEKLWNLYPKKVGKKPAFAAYKRAVTRKKNPATNKQIQNGIVAYRRIKAAEGTAKEYIKNGDTFFKQEAWGDFTEVAKEEQAEKEARKPQFDPRQTAIAMYIDYNSLDRVLEEIKAQGIPIKPEDAQHYITEYDERRQQA